MLNCIGIGFQRGTHNNWQLVHNDGTRGPTLIKLGAGFPVASMTNVLTLYIAAAPNGSDIGVRVVEEVSGEAIEVTISTDMPATTLLLRATLMRSPIGLSIVQGPTPPPANWQRSEPPSPR